VACAIPYLLSDLFVTTMPVIRASVVQSCSAAFSLPDTLEKLKKLAQVAKERDGSQLAVFPEGL
jgi:predicted amidohydrolase